MTPLTIPAILSVVEESNLRKAFHYFKSTGKPKLYFFTDSRGMGPAFKFDNIQSVYFKPSPQKDLVEIVAKADFVTMEHDNPKYFRLVGCENDTGKYYYGFTNLRRLGEPMPVFDLRYFETHENLIPSVPGCCIIEDPQIE